MTNNYMFLWLNLSTNIPNNSKSKMQVKSYKLNHIKIQYPFITA